MSRVTLIAYLEHPEIWKEVTVIRNFFSSRFIGRKTHFEFWPLSWLYWNFHVWVQQIWSQWLESISKSWLRLTLGVPYFENRRPELSTLLNRTRLFLGHFTPEGPNREASGEELRASRPPGSCHPSHPPWHSSRTPPWVPGSSLKVPKILPSSNPSPTFLDSKNLYKLRIKYI